MNMQRHSNGGWQKNELHVNDYNTWEVQLQLIFNSCRLKTSLCQCSIAINWDVTFTIAKGKHELDIHPFKYRNHVSSHNYGNNDTSLLVIKKAIADSKYSKSNIVHSYQLNIWTKCHWIILVTWHVNM